MIGPSVLNRETQRELAQWLMAKVSAIRKGLGAAERQPQPGPGARGKPPTRLTAGTASAVLIATQGVGDRNIRSGFLRTIRLARCPRAGNGQPKNLTK